MIIVINKRDKGNNVTYTDQHLHSVEKALSILLECEVRFGADILELTPTKVVTETHVMGDIDTTEFIGPSEEMKWLVKAARYTLEARKQLYTEEGQQRLSKQLMDFTKGNPGLMEMSFGMISGMGTLRNVALGILTEGNVERLPTLVSLRQEDILPLLYTMIKFNIPFDEALTLAA